MTSQKKMFTVIFVTMTFLLSLLSEHAVQAKPSKFFVEGEVYCEICRTDFINKLSEPMPGARVNLQCKGEGEGNVTYSLEGVTNEKGVYRLAVEGDHEDEECAVSLVKSSRPDCSEILDEGWAAKPSSKVVLTKNSGFHGNVRKANPLGFTMKTAAPQCAAFLKEIDVNNNDD